ncbi:universal stress protein [Microbacterium elymi]|uniref:Universal stress protein n=1 Tax=Microbacterium elymi TaxID=2909587 RepID=A0ABY5NI26_9MICO|nr:universal stress protein [Microbacterium elymi]UUT34835.1 universal stress protein [Microbacterium elymi]
MDDSRDRDRVLVGVDGSNSSIEALRYAARIAAALGSPLSVATAWTFHPLVSPYLSDSWSPERDAEMVLDTAIESAFADVPPPLNRAVLIGPAALTLIEESAYSAMLVLGSRGHGGFAGLLLGSVSAACAEHGHCPVLIVHPRRQQEGTRGGPDES